MSTLPSTTAPMTAARLGMWLFLASETMFFAGVIGGFLVLQNAGAEHPLFLKSAKLVTGFSLVGVCTMAPAVLSFASSVVLMRARRHAVLISVALAVAILAVEFVGSGNLLRRHTVAVVDTAAGWVYDGTVETRTKAQCTMRASRTDLPEGFDVHQVVSSDLAGPRQSYSFPIASIRQDASYGPSRNNFFAIFFLVTAVHAVHVIGGLLAIGWLYVCRRRETAFGAVVMYLHFVNAMGLAGLLLYFSARV